MHMVVVLNWFGRDDTITCVRSLIEGDADIEVLVVDNGSFDGALEDVASLERVRGLQLPRNLGFTGGMNRGIRWALEAGADTVTILNNDTVVPPGTMAELARAAEGRTAVSPMVMHLDEPDRVWFGGGTLDMPDGYPHHTALDQLEPCVEGQRTTDLLAGCCITASADSWRTAGLFDERFFLNFEDSEWSLRARTRGMRLAVVCDVSILHAVSASFTGAAATLGGFYFQRNGLLFAQTAGAGVGARWRFFRRFGLTAVRRAGTWRGRRRAAYITTAALLCFALRRFGEAPPAVRRRARRWSSQPTA
jgi:GT2 family glycosyltransferase